LNPWIVAVIVAAAGGTAFAWLSRHWLIGAVAVGLGTPFVLAIGDELVSGRPNKFIALVIVLLSLLTVPTALIAAYSTFRYRTSRAPPNNRWRGP
jgi:hypothetical protein